MSDAAESKLYGTPGPPPSGGEPPASYLGAGDGNQAGNEEADTVEEVATEDKLFGSDESALLSTYEPSLMDSQRSLEEIVPDMQQHRSEWLQEVSGVFHDARIPTAEASTIYTVFTSAIKDRPTDEQVAAWGAETREMLEGRYGDYKVRLEEAKRFVHERPELKRLLHETGLGNHPRIVSALVERAYEHKRSVRK